MSKEKQIEELAEILRKVCDATPNGKRISKLCCECRAETVIEAGYRKQEEGEWIINGVDGNLIGNWRCSSCRGVSLKDSNYCPNCGARMKGV